MSAESSTAIVVRGVDAGYPSAPVLRGIDLDIPRGKITALIGANGCGKSTLLKTIARVLPAAAGSVVVNGTDTTRYSRRDFARELAVLPQTPVAPEGLTVRELCRFGRHPHRSLHSMFAGATREDDAIVEAALAGAGLTELADAIVDELSGGQRQRAWIAMALAQDTPVLLLDEPTTYLDIAHQNEVLQLLRRLNADSGRTIVMVLHDLNQAARFAHHVIAVADGAVAAAGPPDTVITPDVIAATFGIACAVVPHPLDGSPLCLPLD